MAISSETPRGDYNLEQRIGRGGMAQVFRAVHRSTGRVVALKVIHYGTSLEDLKTFKLRFAQEAKLIASLEHLHIVPIYDYGIADDGVAHIAMRLLPRSLHDHMKTRRLPLPDVWAIFAQIADGISYAHQRGVVHRDIKPSNILLDETDNAYVTDFGLAKLLEASLRLTQTGVIVGAPAYAAPEQIADKPTDRRSDIYSLGVLIYHMLAGEHPFARAGVDFVRLMHMKLHDPFPILTLDNERIAHHANQVIARAVALDPAARFESVDKLKDSLRDALQIIDTPITVSDPLKTREAHAITGAGAPKRSKLPKHTGTILRVTLFTLMGCGVGILLYTRIVMYLLPLQLTIERGEPVRAADYPGISVDAFQTRLRLLVNGSFVAYIACSLDSEFAAIMARDIDQGLDNYNIPVRVYDPAMNAQTQASMIRTALHDGAAGFIICPLEESEIASALRAVNEHRRALLLLAPLQGDYHAVSMDSHNDALAVQAGLLAGEYIIAQGLIPGNVVLVTMQSPSGVAQRGNGMLAGLAERAPNARIAAVYDHVPNAEIDDEFTQRILDAQLSFDVVLTVHDTLAFGVIDALSDARIADDRVGIFSIGSETPAQAYIEAGRYLRASVSADRDGLASAVVNVMLRMLHDVPVPERVESHMLGVVTSQGVR